MPDYATISSPYWKGYILIECADGKIYKYVRSIVKRASAGATAPWKGDSLSTNYIWGDSIGDTIGQTADTAGRIMFDFNRLSMYFTQLSSTTGTFMKWNEPTGDTFVLRRLNKEQLQPYNASSPNNPNIFLLPGGNPTTGTIGNYGDTNSYRAYNIQAYTYLRLAVSQIQSISVIQERIPDWYKNAQFTIQGSNYPSYPGVKV
jgi:hypothetical protein